ncbi:MAG TPA: hypothetical protein PKC43_02915 [Phycisphaerales bacterium]|nr:hypothetical protein [Phycisphaerales bacterium]HMP36378.1 hypothetical protein [Phycisphaerales bacterium]
MPHSLRPLTRRLASGFASLALALGAGCAASLLDSPAAAQFGGFSAMSEAFSPDLLQRDIVVFHENLALEEWQRPVIEVLLADYVEAFSIGSELVREQMSQVRVDGASSSEVIRRLMAPVNQWIKDKEALRVELLESIRMQLGQEQLERWPAFERALRREKSLGSGVLSGESTNLFLIVKGLPLDRDAVRAVQPALAEYEVLLDNALQRREAAMKAQQDAISRAMIEMDHSAGLAAMEQITQARVIVRQAQDQGATIIAEALPEDVRAEFVRRWRENAYPKIFRAPALRRTFEVARSLPDLTSEQRAGIDRIEADYITKLDALNLQMLDTLRLEEPREFKRKAEAAQNRQPGRPVERIPDALAQFDPIRDSYEQEARLALEALLNPEQVAMLPSAGKGTSGRDRQRDLGDRADPKAGDGRRPNLDRGGAAGRGDGSGDRRPARNVAD